MKRTVTEMKNAFDGLISRLDMAEEGISELEEVAIGVSKSEKQREQRLKGKKENRLSKDCETTTKSCNGNTRRRRKREETEEIF